MKCTVIAATTTLDSANDMLTEAALSKMAEMAVGMEIRAGFEQDSPVVGKVKKSVSSDGNLTLVCDFDDDVEKLYVVPGFKIIDYEIAGKDRIIKEVDLLELSITATPVDFHVTQILPDLTQALEDEGLRWTDVNSEPPPAQELVWIKRKMIKGDYEQAIMAYLDYDNDYWCRCGNETATNGVFTVTHWMKLHIPIL